jgi:brefeldin A-inhibited guanine nucleotide-exchange protein
MAEGSRISTSSIQSAVSASGSRSGCQSGSTSEVFIRLALDQLSNSKDIKRNTNLLHSILVAQKTLEESSDDPLDHDTLLKILAPFQLACGTSAPALVSISIDCLGKLFSYNFWGRHAVYDEADPEIESPEDIASQAGDEPAESGSGIMGLVIDSICESFVGPDIEEKIQMQILKVIRKCDNSRRC